MKFIRSRRFRELSIIVAADAVMFGLTNARNVPSLGLMIGFILLVATIYYLISNLLSLTKLYGLTINRQKRLVLAVTGVVSILAALQSIGELSSLDVLVITLLAVIGYVYSFYYSRSEPGSYHQF